jgi:DNA polymerase I-like protein with 3'-5' exonuclease and polymerase domains
MLAAGREEGNIKLDEEACLLSGDPVLKAYTEFSQATTLRSKAERLQRSPIQCRYNVLVATGRTSCSQGDDPKPGEAWTAYGMQVQNLPQKPGVRECFVARPGHAIVSVDYDAFEMRAWAQCCKWVLGYSDLADILNDPKRCPHVEMGAGLKHLSVAEAYALKGEERKALRGVAKGPNFGLPGGMGAARLMDYCRLSYGVELTLSEAQEACAVWRRVYREAQPYLDWVSRLIGQKRGSTNTIEQFVSKRLRGQVGFCDAANGFFQGLAADIAKAAGWKLIEQAYEIKTSALYGCRPLAFVHDEWLYEVPLDRLTEAGNLMAKIQTQVAVEWCPDVLFTASPAAMLAWSKRAGDPVYDSKGDLIPYEWRAS